MKITDTNEQTQNLSRYLFGESVKKTRENAIYLNKSGWVQVNQIESNALHRKLDKRINGGGGNSMEPALNNFTSPAHLLKNHDHVAYQQPDYIVHNTTESNMPPIKSRSSSLKRYDKGKSSGGGGSISNSNKIDGLISRSEARRNSSSRASERITVITDPHISALLNERPGFLPVREYERIDSPPLVTPIISPPPAFQDLQQQQSNKRFMDDVSTTPTTRSHHQKGMVFSKSFEYDMKQTPKPDTKTGYSRSFDFDFDNSSLRRRFSKDADRMFSTLTGISPNYLNRVNANESTSGTLRSKSKDRASSYDRSMMGDSLPRNRRKNTMDAPDKKSNRTYSQVKRADFSKSYDKPSMTIPFHRGFRSLDHSVNARLNSCDSGARSDLSNDDDGEDIFKKKKLLTKHLKIHAENVAKKQRNLNQSDSSRDDSYAYVERKKLQHYQQQQMERRRLANISDELYTVSRQRQQFDIGRCSSPSSSSYSDCDERDVKQHNQFLRNIGENRIKRSRSLQLSEKLPKKSNDQQRFTVRIGEKQSIQSAKNSSRYNPDADPVHLSNDQFQIRSSLDFPTMCDNEECSEDYTAKYLFDKSRSFDDDYKNCGKTKSFTPEYRSKSNDRVYPTASIERKPIKNVTTLMPDQRQNYGTRLYDHEMMYNYYDREKMNRSPIIEFGRSRSSIANEYLKNYSSGPLDGGSSSNSSNSNNLKFGKILKNKNADRQRLMQLQRKREQLPRDDDVNEAHSTPPDTSNNKILIAETNLSVENQRHYKNPDHINESDTSGSQIRNEPTTKPKEKPHKMPMTGSYARSLEHWPPPPLFCGPINTVTSHSLSCMAKHKSNIFIRRNNNSSSCSNSNNQNRVNYHDETNTIDATTNPMASIVPNDMNIIRKDQKSQINVRKPLKSLINNSNKNSRFSNDNRTITGPTNLSKHFQTSQNTFDHDQSYGDNNFPLASPLSPSRPLSLTKIQLDKREMPITRDSDHANKIQQKSVYQDYQQDNSQKNECKACNERIALSLGRSLSQMTEHKLRTQQRGCEKVPQLSNIPVSINDEITRASSAPLAKKLIRSLSLPDLRFNNQKPLPVEILPTFHGTLSPKTLLNQMKAVSSPSLTENNPSNDLHQTEEKVHQSIREETTQLLTATNIQEPLNANRLNVPNSVLQRLKNTLTNFHKTRSTHQQQHSSQPEQGKDTLDSTTITNHTAKYRIGPLVWRTSKERKKQLHTSNSGDSGIQVEIIGGSSGGDGFTTTSVLTASDTTSSDILSSSVRRSNSAKEASLTHLFGQDLSTGKIKYQSPILPLAKRSYSQPFGLNDIDQKMPNYESDFSDTLATAMAMNENDDNDNDDDAVNVYESLLAEVLYTFKAMSTQELSLDKGALIEVIKRDAGPWWWGRIKHDAIFSDIIDHIHPAKSGWFPKDFVRILPSFPTKSSSIGRKFKINKFIIESKDFNDQLPAAVKTFTGTSAKKLIKKLVKQNHVSSDCEHPCQLLSKTDIIVQQQNIIKELLDTEVNYVHLLAAICDGFVKELKLRPEIFSAKSINIIFSNIEQIYGFQQIFLHALQAAVEQKKIAETFLEFQYAFMMYSTYCNSYPSALIELESYTGNTESSTLLESCRIKQNLPDLPLSAHLLVPIQRICRYPLHLSELVKHSFTRHHLIRHATTPEDRNDLNHHTTEQYQHKIDTESGDCKEMFELALASMKHITETVNEGKRHSEYLSGIQARFENFQGPPLAVHSTRLFLQTDAIRMTPNLWNNSYTLFLFDHQLIYCKRDIIKRSTYLYKGRIFLDNCRVLNLNDGRFFGVTLKNTLRLYSDTRNKWFDFSFRSSTSKARFLHTLSIERRFCGQQLFITELDGLDEGDDDWYAGVGFSGVGGGGLSDRENIYISSDYMGEFVDRKMKHKHLSPFNDRVLSMDNIPLQHQDQQHRWLIDKTDGDESVAMNKNTTFFRYLKKGETLPKKSKKKLTKDRTAYALALTAAGNINAMDHNHYHQTDSLEKPSPPTSQISHQQRQRKRFDYWVRRAKSSNSTPSHSPTHPSIIGCGDNRLPSSKHTENSSSQNSLPFIDHQCLDKAVSTS